MKKSIKNLDTRKVIGTVIGGIVFVCCLLYFTYAFYNWRSTNTLVDLTIEDISGGECAIGPDVNAVNIGPVLNIWDGVIADFSVNNDAASVYEIGLSLNIDTIHEDLRVESFKYALVQDIGNGSGFDYENPILEGNFEDATDDQTLVLADTDASTDIPSLEIAGNASYSFQFIVYIDGSMYNSNEMQSTTTETKGLYSSLTIGDCGSIFSKNAAEYIQSLYNDGSEINTVNIAGDDSKPEVHLNTTQGIMLDNNGNYRYYGADPNNYIKYNNELWRIISVGNVKSNENDTIGQTRIKIVKLDALTAKETGTNTDITDFSYDSSVSDVNSGYGVNDWSKADLMTELNTLYYNGTTGTCYVGRNNASKACDFTKTGLSQNARNLTSDALYYLGGAVTTEIDNLHVNDFYNFERGTNVWGSSNGQTCNDGACPRVTSWTGRVGLIYPSDYIYAADLSLCRSVPITYGSDTNCNSNWLKDTTNATQWTISPIIDNAYSVFDITGGGNVYVYGSVYSNAASKVHPVQYLKANVILTGGNGTKDKPYTIAANSFNAAEYIQSLYNDGSTLNTVNIAGDVSKPQVHLNEEQGIMLDNNGDYRYYGSEPDNFVEFNDELWRIISVGNVKSSIEDANPSMRLKLIRYESIGDYSFDGIDMSTSINDWSKSDLKFELNTLYYNNGDTNYAYGSGSTNFSSNVLSNDAMNMIDDAVWYLGGTTSDGSGADDDSLYANDYYNFERGTNVWGASSDQTCNDSACPRATSWVGLVGLINPSDYAYSTDLSVCTVPGANYATGCVDTTWFSYSNHRSIWTLNPNSSNATTLFVVGGAGEIGNYRVSGYFTNTYMENAVYPVVYLKENVDIIDGYGTSEEPYIIELIEE